MAKTTPSGLQIRDGSIQRDDLDASTVGQAVVRKIIQGTGISLSSTGADSGTGDVTVNSSISAGSTLYVDSTNGNDGTGTRGRIDKPYLTIAGANGAASSGDIIIVRPGTYDEKNIIKNNINYFFNTGAKVISTTTTQGAIIDDSSFGQNGAVTSIISGYGDFIRQFSNSDTGGKSNTINLVNTSSNVSLTCRLLQDNTTGTGAPNTWTIRHGGGTLQVRAETISGNGVIWWTDGDERIVANKIIGTSSSNGSNIYSSPGSGSQALAFPETYTTGFLWIEAQTISLAGSATLQGGTLTPRVWIFVKGDMVGNVASTGSRNYITAQKLTGKISTSNSTAGSELWIQLEKHSTTVNSVLIQPGGGSTDKLWYQCLHIDPYSSSISAVILALGGVAQLTIGELTTASNINAFSSFGGTVTINGATIDTTASSSSDAVILSGGTLTLNDCKITSASGRKDINRSSGTVNVINGRGTNADGTFATTGTINYLSSSLRKDANLSDLASSSTARTNLGLGTIATQNSNAIAITGGTITGIGTPSADSDVAIKSYVDSAISGLDVKASVRVATAAALPAYTRTTNVLNANANGTLPTIDGVTMAASDRVLVKDGAAGADNGIYVINSLGSGGSAWQMTRSTDADSSAEVTAGLYTFVTEGTTNGDYGFVLTTNDPITLNTTSLTFTQFSGAGQITVNSTLTKTGNQLSLNLGNANTWTAAQIINAGTNVTNLTLQGNLITGAASPPSVGVNWTGYFYGTGSYNRIGVDGSSPAVELIESGTRKWQFSSTTGVFQIYNNAGAGPALEFDTANKGHFYSNVAIGAAPSATIALIANNTTEQLRLQYDGSNYFTHVVGSTGSVTLDLVGTSPIFIFSKAVKLGTLTTNGFVKTSNSDGTLSVDTTTYLTANQTITLSGDVTGSGATAITTTIANNAVTNAKAAQMAANTIKGNNTASTANASDLTVTQTNILLGLQGRMYAAYRGFCTVI